MVAGVDNNGRVDVDVWVIAEDGASVSGLRCRSRSADAETGKKIVHPGEASCWDKYTHGVTHPNYAYRSDEERTCSLRNL